MDVIISPDFFMSVYFASFINTRKSSYRILTKKLSVVNKCCNIELFCHSFFPAIILWVSVHILYKMELTSRAPEVSHIAAHWGTQSSPMDWSPSYHCQVLTLVSSTIDSSFGCFGLADTGVRGLQRNMTIRRKGVSLWELPNFGLVSVVSV